MNIPDESLNNALNTLREYLQGTMRDLATLRETGHNSGQRLGQLTADVEILRQEVRGVQENTPALDALRQELLVALHEIDHLHCQRVNQLTTEVEALRQEFLANLRETGDIRGQRLDQLAADLETMSQRLLTALREAGATRDQRLDQLTTDLDTLRGELQDARQNASELDTLRQELHGIRQNNLELERSLRTQLAKAREQLDTHTRELATLTERTQAQRQEMSEHIQTLTGLHKQEQSQRETALATLSKLNERIGNLEQQIDANQTRAVDALHVDQDRLAALEKWLTTQAEQFGRFDPVLRELHGELVAAHRQLAALESIGITETLEHHNQRLSEAEQQVHDQADALGEIQQALAPWATQGPETAKRNRQLIGALAVAGVVITALLIILAVG